MFCDPSGAAGSSTGQWSCSDRRTSPHALETMSSRGSSSRRGLQRGTQTLREVHNYRSALGFAGRSTVFQTLRRTAHQCHRTAKGQPWTAWTPEQACLDPAQARGVYSLYSIAWKGMGCDQRHDISPCTLTAFASAICDPETRTARGSLNAKKRRYLDNIGPGFHARPPRDASCTYPVSSLAVHEKPRSVRALGHA